MPPVHKIYPTFDEHITKVVDNWTGTLLGSGSTEWTISGSETTMDWYGSVTHSFVVTLADGYVIDTVVVDGSEISFTENTFTITTSSEKHIVITSKQAAVCVSVDLTSLAGFADISPGSHTLTIKAKANGYSDSLASAGVTFEKAASGETWVLNETLTTIEIEADVNFVSNGESFAKMYRGYTETSLYLPDPSNNYLAYWPNVSSASGVINAYHDGVWMDEAYRTVTFSTTPTGDLFTWLQANATKQGDGGVITVSADGNIWADIGTDAFVMTKGDFVGSPVLFTTANEANRIQVGSKGYDLIRRVNDPDSVFITANEFLAAFGVTTTNKGNSIAGRSLDFVTPFSSRLSTVDGTDGGSFVEWGLNNNASGSLDSIKEMEKENLLFIIYDCSTDTVQACELDTYDAEMGIFSVTCNAGYNTMVAFALGG